MAQSIIQNLINVGWALLIFLAAYASNIIFSLWYNIKIQRESFEWSKLAAGAVKCFVFLLGLSLLCISVTALPQYATMIGWPVPEEFTDLFSDLVIIGAFLLVACRYIKEALTKLLAILNDPGSSDTEESPEDEETTDDDPGEEESEE